MNRMIPMAIGFAAFVLAQYAASRFELTLGECGVVFAACFFGPYALWRRWRIG